MTQTRIIATGTQKGGPGKTTTVVNVMAALAWAGQRVVIADLDPQGDATLWTGTEAQAGKTVGSLLSDRTIPTEAVLVDRTEILDGVPDRVDGGALYVLPAERGDLIAGINEITRNPAAGIFSVRNKLRELDGKVDWIGIDLRPDLDFLVGAAMMAADAAMVVMAPQLATMRGGMAFRESLELLRSESGATTRFLGVVLNQYEPGEESKWVEDELERAQLPVFNTRIPRSKLASKALAYGRPAVLQYPGSALASAFVDLAVEMQERFEGRATQ